MVSAILLVWLIRWFWKNPYYYSTVIPTGLFWQKKAPRLSTGTVPSFCYCSADSLQYGLSLFQGLVSNLRRVYIIGNQGIANLDRIAHACWIHHLMLQLVRESRQFRVSEPRGVAHGIVNIRFERIFRVLGALQRLLCILKDRKSRVYLHVQLVRVCKQQIISKQMGSWNRL